MSDNDKDKPLTVEEFLHLGNFDLEKLEKEFSTLEFDFSMLHTHELIHVNQSDPTELITYLFLEDYPSIPADGIVIKFKINSIEEDQPYIHAITTHLVNASPTEYVILIEKKYLLQNGDLPTKYQIIHDLLESLRIQKVKELFGLADLTSPKETVKNRYN